MTPESKVCKDCLIEKPASEYGRTHKANLQPYCKDCSNIRNQMWYSQNVEYKRAEQQNRRDTDPLASRSSIARSRAKRRGRLVADVDFAEIYDRDDGICGICGLFVDPIDWEMDHVLPYAAGGTHEPENVQVSHMQCNRSKNKYTDYSPYCSV